MEPHSPEHASAMLDQLRDDRVRLNAMTETPWWVPIALGLITGVWVASPAVGDRTVGYTMALVSVAVLVLLARRQMGVKLRISGASVWVLAVIWLAITLTAYSVALGLISLQLTAWVAVPALAAAAVTVGMARSIDRRARAAAAS
ncbi:hypothetical protein [Tessaracoccus flavus]|uniref:Uncharacterized protein n=1 Tax=Tessaracoccus flavus TaxID=1610493 RepID=A0A1Q2CBD8_9ACTN|nr:hypothetical protein [Tessaracoccus flavus]AQP43424.1 hypothetical protein RPIT_00125 [Tessaracoccus flavus]SDZ04915.1 hypothetical protein SAMN05428934_10920 [Tessaracoccus flavus]